MNVIGVRYIGMAAVFVLLSAIPALGGNVGGLYYSPHNFAAMGNSSYARVKEARLCIFCHTPHHASSEGPLWSRDTAYQDGRVYTMYASPTLDKTTTRFPKPTGASRLCLGCHDGTIAVGTLTGGYAVTDAPAITGNAVIAKNNDLSADHPISFVYPSLKPELAAPTSLPGIKLGPNNTVECTACHDPHSNEFGSFLVKNNSDGALLCTTCHQTPGWVTTPYAIHKTSNNTLLTNKGCGACHQSHKSPGAQNLLKYGSEQVNCLSACHLTVGAEFTDATNKSSHPVSLYPGIHAANETLPATDKHVKCADCHNPHQALASAAQPTPPLITPRPVSGTSTGVQGISSGGVTVTAQYEYEVCFRCHSGALNAGNFVGPAGPFPYRPSRVYDTVDERQRFAVSNSSFHPVVGKTTNAAGSHAVKSLLTPLSGTFIACADCHAPHRSPQYHLLTAQYDTSSKPYVVDSYRLCFNCHDATYVMDPASSGFPYHRSHVDPTTIGRSPVPCSGCHDPHGVVLNDNLINFDKTLLSSLTNPVPVYTLNGTQGSCTVSCHTTGTSPNAFTQTYPVTP